MSGRPVLPCQASSPARMTSVPEESTATGTEVTSSMAATSQPIAACRSASSTEISSTFRSR